MSKTVKQLKLLRSIKPSKEWSVTTRDLLLSQIQSQGVSQAPSKMAGFVAYAGDTFATVYESTFGILFARPLRLMAALAVFVAGSSSAVIFAQGSTPGDPLYSVKQTKEQIQVAFAPNPENRAQLEVSLVDERFSELKVVSGKELSQEVKNEQTGALVSEVAKKLSSVTKSLDSIKHTSEPKKAAEIAGYVSKKAEEYQKALAASTGDASHSQKVAQAITKIDETKTKALEVIVEKQDSAGIPDEEVALQLANTIKETQDTVQKIRVSIAALEDEAQELVAKQQEAVKVLAEAEGLLAKKEFKVILFKLNQSKGIVSELNKKIQTKQTETKKNSDGQDKVRAF
ncbi:hypothetical protein HY620_00915 [Candidatus Uhrbacteria bacterium]|nr:hypothetical protein [Candidatus Uhrbacteria bacterium]